MNNLNKSSGLPGMAGIERLRKVREAAGQADQWQSVLTELGREYPGLDLAAALQKPELKALLRAGIDFKTAFEAANLADIKAMIAARAEQTMVDRMAMNALRARENGIAAAKASPFASGSDNLSKSDREEIVKRVLRGEEIRL